MPKNYTKEETEGKWITVRGRHILVKDGESVEDALSRSDKAMGKSKEKVQSLEKRLKGNALLDAQDMIEELKANEAKVDKNGCVTLYHHTTSEAANAIKKSGYMTAKEDGVFFTTKKDSDAQAGGRGDAVVTLKIPVEKLQIDDEFGDEVHVRIPLRTRNDKLDVSKWLEGK